MSWDGTPPLPTPPRGRWSAPALRGGGGRKDTSRLCRGGETYFESPFHDIYCIFVFLDLS